MSAAASTAAGMEDEHLAQARLFHAAGGQQVCTHIAKAILVSSGCIDRPAMTNQPGCRWIRGPMPGISTSTEHADGDGENRQCRPAQEGDRQTQRANRQANSPEPTHIG